MDFTNLENGMNEREALDNDSRKVVELLSALPRVEAPGDFDFGVKAKIAAGNSRSHSGLFSFFKVAAPLSLVLLVGAFVMFYGILPNNSTVADVTEAPPSAAAPIKDSVLPAPPKEEIQTPATHGPLVAQRDENRAATGSLGRRESVTPRRTDPFKPEADAGSGSRDLTLTPANVITAPGFPSDLGPNRNENSNSSRVTDLTVREVFKTLGMEGDFVDGGWKVRSTSENSVAAQSGIRSNDIIESVDGRPLNASTKLKASFEGKSVNVRREGKQIKLDLKN